MCKSQDSPTRRFHRGASFCARHVNGFFVMVTTCRERAFSSSVLAASARSSSCVSGFTSAAGPLFVRRLAICAQEQLFVGHQCVSRQPLPRFELRGHEELLLCESALASATAPPVIRRLAICARSKRYMLPFSGGVLRRSDGPMARRWTRFARYRRGQAACRAAS